MGNAWERGPPRPRGSPSLGGSETSSQVSVGVYILNVWWMCVVGRRLGS